MQGRAELAPFATHAHRTAEATDANPSQPGMVNVLEWRVEGHSGSTLAVTRWERIVPAAVRVLDLPRLVVDDELGLPVLGHRAADAFGLGFRVGDTIGALGAFGLHRPAVVMRNHVDRSVLRHGGYWHRMSARCNMWKQRGCCECAQMLHRFDSIASSWA